jgi:DNA repair protein RadA/Sms
MAKQTVEHVCQNCGYKTPKWLGKCPSCSQWDTMIQEVATQRKSQTSRFGSQLARPLKEINISQYRLISTGISEFDRVLGGGFTSNSTILISGDPGIGKSTLLLQALNRLSAKSFKCLYVTGEESPNQIKMRAERIGNLSDSLYVLAETNLDRISSAFDEIMPSIAVIDSVQTIYSEETGSMPGTLSQIRETAFRLIELAKARNVTIFFIGHVTKEGLIAGPMSLEHMVDTVIYFEGDTKSQYRILRAIKNRFGATNEIGIFEMSDSGLKEIENPSQIFLPESTQAPCGGSVVLASMEGTRPFLVEVQALCTPSSYSVPTRISTGIDRTRVMLLVAILEKKLGVVLANQDIYVNVTGGFRINERAGDLAVAGAILSSFYNKKMPPKAFTFGELGLTGESRASLSPNNRISEGEKIGLTSCFLPTDNLKHLKGRDSKIELIGVKSIEDFADKLF